MILKLRTSGFIGKKNQQQYRDDQTIYQESVNQNVSLLGKYHYNRDDCKF